MRAALRSLPTTLDETYERILATIKQKDRSYAFRTLQWLTFAARPMSVAEVAAALTVDLDCESPHVDPGRALRNPNDILDICVSLVSVSRRKGRGIVHGEPLTVLQLAHFSVKEFLLSTHLRYEAASDFSLSAELAHKALAECCLAYFLQFDRDMSVGQPLAKPLTLYAALNWTLHARQAGNDCRTIQLLGTRLLMPTTHYLQYWHWFHGENGRWAYSNTPRKSPLLTPLYYMALTGVECLVRTLVLGDADVNARGGKYGNALQAASAKGHRGIVQLLLDNGADVNARGGYHHYALHAASENGHCEVLRLLLDHGADVIAEGHDKDTALMRATIMSDRDVVEVLLDAGADAVAEIYIDVVWAAMAYRLDEMLQLLISKGTGRFAHRGRCAKLLVRASRLGLLQVVQQLLDNGTDVNARDDDDRNALLMASVGGHCEVARLLLDKGADKNAGGRHLTYQMLEALFRGHRQDGRAGKNIVADSLQGAASGNAVTVRELGQSRVLKLLANPLREAIA